MGTSWFQEGERMKKIIVTLIATMSILIADDAQKYMCKLVQASMLDAQLTPKEGETAALSVRAKRISIVPGYAGVFDRTTNSYGTEIRYYKADNEDVEIAWLPNHESVNISYKGLFNVYYTCMKR